jgi:hypothetical protein
VTGKGNQPGAQGTKKPRILLLLSVLLGSIFSFLRLRNLNVVSSLWKKYLKNSRYIIPKPAALLPPIDKVEKRKTLFSAATCNL